MKTPLTFLLSLTFLFFVGCAAITFMSGGDTGKWMKEGSNERDYSRDFAKCQGLTANVKWIDVRTNAFNHCMYGEGWDWVIEGKNMGKK